MSNLNLIPPDGVAQTMPMVEMRQIDKGFPGVVANAQVNFSLRAGEVHALLGENGAGKSTLMNILTGIYEPDAGEILMNGQPASFRNPGQAIAAGIGMVHQHFKLVQAFTAAENLHLGAADTPHLISRATLRRRTQELENRYGLKVSPDTPVYKLSAGEQQRIEIIKALSRGAKVLILDEPTAVLTDEEAELLFKVIRQLTADGLSVVFISHKLDEVLQISDRITVLRSGKNVATIDTTDADQDVLARRMVGHAVTPESHLRETTKLAPVMTVRGLATAAGQGTCALDNIDLTIRSGEILGVAGVAGNGQRELSEAITGLRQPTAGSITIDGIEVSHADARTFVEAGIGHIPEDRLRSAVAPTLSLARNAVLREYTKPPVSSGPWLRQGAAQDFCTQLLRVANVTAPSISAPIRNLSGGNQQRFVVARETRIATRALVAAYPTRGLDIAATETVHQALIALRNRGIAVVVFSEDLDELMALADRMIVLYDGRIAGERASPWDRQDLGLLMGGRTDVRT